MVLMNMPKVNILLEDREDGKDGSLFGLNLLLGISLSPFEGRCATFSWQLQLDMLAEVGPVTSCRTTRCKPANPRLISIQAGGLACLIKLPIPVEYFSPTCLRREATRRMVC